MRIRGAVVGVVVALVVATAACSGGGGADDVRDALERQSGASGETIEGDPRQIPVEYRSEVGPDGIAWSDPSEASYTPPDLQPRPEGEPLRAAQIAGADHFLADGPRTLSDCPLTNIDYSAPHLWDLKQLYADLGTVLGRPLELTSIRAEVVDVEGGPELRCTLGGAVDGDPELVIFARHPVDLVAHRAALEAAARPGTFLDSAPPGTETAGIRACIDASADQPARCVSEFVVEEQGFVVGGELRGDVGTDRTDVIPQIDATLIVLESLGMVGAQV